MEHLDLAGFITTPTHWTMPAFDQQDAVYLSSSRQMLEPILEETSEDEEHAQNNCSSYEHVSNVWSSAESETGSVIRIEVTKDADSISERDFACPAKRPRRSDECLNLSCSAQPTSLDDSVILRRFQRSNEAYDNNSLERFLACELQFGNATSRDSLGASSQQRSSTGSRRFDDFYSDSDSLSYHSLSRSSSLIQFESLERQMLQDQHSSLTSLGNSSPSVLSFEGACVGEETRKSNGDVGSSGGSGGNSGCNSGNNSRRGSQSSLLRRFESADGRLHQTYYDLDKLNFDDNEEKLRRIGGSKANAQTESNTIVEVKSDSESSTTSSSSSGNSILNASKPSAEDLTVNHSSTTAARIAAFQRGGGKNSAENLSEDSGYCEPSTLRRTKSKSIPKNFEKFCEEEEFFTEHEHKAIEAIDVVVNAYADDDRDEEDDDDDGDETRNTHSKNSTVIENDLCQPKIASLDSTFVVSSTSMSASPMIAPTDTHSSWLRYDDIKNSNAREPPSLSEHLAQYQPQQAHKQARSLAHSPSPVSDAGSTSSNASSSCASANSFTWLPTHSQPNSQHPQPQPPMMSLSNAQRHKQLPQSSTPDFSEQLRNSLPDIREANGSFGANYYSTPQKNSSYVVDPPKERAPPHHRQQRTRTCSLTDSETSSSSDSTTATSPAKLSSGQPSGEGNTTAKTYCGRVSSVPNELDKIGRSRRRGKTKYTKSSAQPASATASSESELTDEDFFDASNARSGRSCSWSENRGDTAQSFEASEGDRRKPLEAQSLGYMNASYHNLTLLDYSGHDPNKSQANGKRSGASKMDSHKNSGDYESIICKGNFLLDELSEIYDRNASILNDQQLEAPPKLEVTAASSGNDGSSVPKPPPRLRKHSNSSHSDVDTADACERQVQHVQITLRKPPARQKHGRRQEAPSSLVSESSAGNFAKTFDQDPTNLHTSYAQSLEQCNFDASELSISADEQQSRSLPKRRFQSHAVVNKKRSLVSSTPNLNAFDPCGDVEDDIYVSSAHNSMHQLPQGSVPKPLGILLPIGSRSSFGKGVSFCPVVSKYSWQEQSSEECNEPPTSLKGREEEESDDELLDNADATVIYNTKENEMIATRYAEAAAAEAAAPNQQRECHDGKENSVNSKESETLRESATQQREPEQPKEQIEAREKFDQGKEQKETQREERVCAVIENIENIATAETSHRSNDVKRRAAQNEAAEKLVSSDRPTAEVVRSAVEPTLVSHKSTSNAVTSNQVNEAPLTLNLRANNNASATTPRPVSLHLPILSEPPTNRAHILYASQQLIDNLAQEQQQQKARQSIPPARTQSAINLSPRQQQQQQQQQVDSKVRVSRMSNLAIKCSESETVGAGLDQAGLKHYNNNNELMKSKFKADEKHPSSKGFLSRFANGFRFSLRRNKKKQLQQQQQQLQQPQQQAEQQSSNIRPAKNASTFFVSNGAKQKTGKQNSPDFIYIPLKGPRPAADAVTDYNVSISSSSSPSSTSANVTLSPSKPSGKQHVSQPALAPMVTGKPPLPKQPPRVVEKPPQLRHSAGGHAPHSAANFASQADQFYTSTKPTTIDEFFLESERSYYADLCRNQLASGMHANGRLLDTVSMDPTLAPTPPSQQFSSPSRASVSQKTQMFNNMSNGKVYVKNQSGGGGGCKIGLIETNLDTHETVISGKTRSLMELGPQQHQQQRFKFIKRVNADASGGQTEIDDGYDDANDGDIEDVVTAADGSRSIVVVKGAAQPAGQIASVRRPHKSMEFLLDKENQKNVLLSSDECQLTKPLKSIRKKKVRRHLLWKKNHSNIELKDRVQTTDSDSDCKVRVTKNPSSPKEPAIERSSSLEEDDKAEKVACKNSKELTPATGSEEQMKSTTSKPNEEIELRTSPHLMVSYEDQGFETGSNELNTSCRLKPSNTFDCSTPIRGQTPQSISTTADQPHRDFNFSPIYIKSLEPSDQSDQKIYSPVSQQVNLEDLEKQATSSPDLISSNHATISIVDKNSDKTSVFWVCIGDFAISIDICYNTEERLLCLYDMFSQKSSDAEGPTYFGIGIDDQVFSVTDSLLEQQKTFKRIPLRENCSQYWFAKGDLAVHFTGKFMCPEKAKHLLNFLQQVVTSSTFLPLHFGVDYIDFSKELWGRDMEFLKNSENVREDCKEHVPCTIQNASCNSSEIKTSDLDHSDFESDECENKDSRRMVTFNLAKSDQREEKSKTFTVKYEGHPRDGKYDDEDLTTSSNHSNLSCLLSNIDLDEIKGSPQYFSKLQEIISAIHDISEETDFKNSSTTELENYAFYLSRYADTCLDTCMKHLDKVLDVLNYRPPTPSN